jgi:tRNA nucleotidyltransferase (CCA-adding enzyme)
MQINLPPKVTQIIKQLEDAGFEAYAVGGCIRDSLLGIDPSDWDITTSATPWQVKEIFQHTIDTGIKHGTVTVMISHEAFEVTTYRIDGEYQDSRHPKEVTFTPNLKEDLKRRDFTINAMAYNPQTGLVDLYNGTQDLNNHTIRCVGDAHKRFTEDALRILRALRFSAQLGFAIEIETQKAMGDLAHTLNNISPERIQSELVKLLASPHPDYIRYATPLGITKVILPELDIDGHVIETISNIPCTKSLRLSALLYTLGEHTAVNVLKRLRFDNDTIIKVRTYIRYSDTDIAPNATAVRKAMNQMGPDNLPGVLALKEARADGDLSHITTLKNIHMEILEKNECTTLKGLKISGTDLISLGFAKGKVIGDTLAILLDDVIKNPDHNTHDYLENEAVEILKTLPTNQNNA